MNQVLAAVCLMLLHVTVASAESEFKSLNTDNNRALDMAEVESAGAAIFATLDRDKEGTLDADELAGRLSADDLAAVDTDHNGKIDRNEYAKVVAIRFKAADSDGDGTVDERELDSPEGAALLKLVH
jgi:Ca2+-binding EF-hand superfamily protein